MSLLSINALSGLAALLLAMPPAVSFAQSCSDTNTILDPDQFDWGSEIDIGQNAHFVGTMEIAEAMLEVGGETINTRIYRQSGRGNSIPGPTLVMQPGKKYVLRFHNLLPPEERAREHNVFKDPNISNLHTHGLHISGMSPGDDITRNFAGNEGGDFVYDIPADHMGGTFWYHAHHHGSTYLQVSAGAFGLIVIDDSADGIPPNVAELDERQLVVAYLDPDVAGTGGDTLISGSLSPTWTINGKVNGDICMPRDSWQHWRLLLADRDASPRTVSVGAGCEVALMARDGVWRTEVPKKLVGNSLELTGASRADLAVRCASDSSISVGGQSVADIVVTGGANPLYHGHPFANDASVDNYERTWSALRPDYLRDLRNESGNLNRETVYMGATTINGERYDKHNATFTLRANAVQDWTLTGARNHPFHLHIYHMQVQENCGSYEDGEYYDVVADNCNIRFDLDHQTTSAYNGRTVMHCHILRHEDQGGMGWLDVQGGETAPTFPDPSVYGYSELYALGMPPTDPPPTDPPPSAPSGLSAFPASVSEIDLAWTDNSSDEDSFDLFGSTDGANFGFIGSVGADRISYTDSGLASDTTYYYRVRAYHSVNGTSAESNTASAITDALPPGGGTQLQIDSITVATVLSGRIRMRGQATVVVKDDTGAMVQRAVVSGYFNQSFDEVVEASDPTDFNGSTTMLTAQAVMGAATVGFCVTTISDGEGVGLKDFSGDDCVTQQRYNPIWIYKRDRHDNEP
jgi:FtsP/CotA-like multicopper oxidase with cupredoxin domain